MELTQLQSILEEVFSANFVLYYRSHQAHVNIRGRNFLSDHKLLQKIYEALQDHIDMLGEKLRTIQATMPESLGNICMLSPISDAPLYGDADELLGGVLEGIEVMIDLYHNLEFAADAVNYTDIANLAQDMIGELAKFKWMLEATLNERD
jgi:starvation-inducible DNA-binding protein